MARIKTYVLDTVVSEKDIVIGSDADNLGTTKNFEVAVLRDFILSGLAPNVGGTLKVTELIDTNNNTTPQAFINSLNPSYIVSPYEVVIVTLNSSKYLLKLQDVVVGSGQTPTISSNFISLTSALSGTLNYLPKFTPNGNTIGNSLVYDNGTTVSIGTASPSASSLLQLDSTNKGLLQPRMTTVQRDAITSPAEGLRIYNTTTKKENFYNGTSWIELQENIVNGTLNKVAKFTPNGTTVGDSSITDTGSLVTISSATNINGTTNVTGTTNLTGPTNIVGATGVTGVTQITGATTVTGATDIIGATTIKSTTTSPANPLVVIKDSLNSIYPLEIRPSQGDTRNTFIGANSGKATTTAAQNTVVGCLSGGSITTGNANTFLGYITGSVVTTASQNTFVGAAAGGLYNTASFNTFLGSQTGYNNASGANNVFLGYNSGNKNENGLSNTFVGSSAGAKNGEGGLNGDYNTALGYAAAASIQTGNRNVYLGYDAGVTLNNGTTSTTGSNDSIFIGAKTKAGNADAQTNQIVIGYGAQGLGTNTTVIGNSSTTITGLHGNIRLMNGMGTAPATSSSTGTIGDIVVTGTYIHVCIAPNTWKRVAIATW